ncbi:MAG: malQ1 [Chloroflexi bacterium]|nr:malQ1 [Chloroflexota bacterium]
MSARDRYSPFVSLGRETCGDPEAALGREWLITNGLGGYAAMSLAGAPTRSYHGYLVAALEPPVARTVLVGGLDEELELDGRTTPLSSFEWAGDQVPAGVPLLRPDGWRRLQSFALDGTIPTWQLAVGGALLEKRAWMIHGANATVVTWTLRRSPGDAPARLRVRPLLTCRDHHDVRPGDDRPPRVTIEGAGASLLATWPGAPAALRVLAPGATFLPEEEWLRGLRHRVETERGLPDRSDLFAPGTLAFELRAGETAALLLAVDGEPVTAGFRPDALLEAERRRLAGLIDRAGAANRDPFLQQLVLAADQFIVRRRIPGEKRPGTSVIAGYPWFNDWGRDTMIALPGLALATGRTDDAAAILRSFAAWVRDGLVPNNFADAERAEPGYHTADASPWFVHAVQAYRDASGDEGLVTEILPVLREIVERHLAGTRFGIGVDPSDGLLREGAPGYQLTWMDAKAGEWVVTPRRGKPVEIQALWIHALRAVAGFCQARGGARGADAGRGADAADRAALAADADRYDAAADRAATSFRARFFRPELGYCADVVDGPDGDELALRPNQLIALALPEPLLAPEQARSVVDACTRALLVPGGLRSLAPDDPAYLGRYGGDRVTRDGAYHQGTAWTWLVGPYCDALRRTGATVEEVREVLEPFANHLRDAGLGSISECLEGDPPHRPVGCFAQAWGVAEVLRSAASSSSNGSNHSERSTTASAPSRSRPGPPSGSPSTVRQPSSARRRSVISAAASRPPDWACTGPALAARDAPRAAASSAATEAAARVCSARAGSSATVARRPTTDPSPATVRPRASRKGQRARARPARSGSSKKRPTSGQAARRTRTAARACVVASRSSASQGTNAPASSCSGRNPSARARAIARACMAKARPARVGGSEGTPRARSGATTSGPAPTITVVPARASRRRRNEWSASARSGSTPPATISASGSASTASTRSRAATIACSGAARADALVASQA